MLEFFDHIGDIIIWGVLIFTGIKLYDFFENFKDLKEKIEQYVEHKIDEVLGK